MLVDPKVVAEHRGVASPITSPAIDRGEDLSHASVTPNLRRDHIHEAQYLGVEPQICKLVDSLIAINPRLDRGQLEKSALLIFKHDIKLALEINEAIQRGTREGSKDTRRDVAPESALKGARFIRNLTELANIHKNEATTQERPVIGLERMLLSAAKNISDLDQHGLATTPGKIQLIWGVYNEAESIHKLIDSNYFVAEVSVTSINGENLTTNSGSGNTRWNTKREIDAIAFHVASDGRKTPFFFEFTLSLQSLEHKLKDSESNQIEGLFDLASKYGAIPAVMVSSTGSNANQSRNSDLLERMKKQLQELCDKNRRPIFGFSAAEGMSPFFVPQRRSAA